jgi:hypothetical protein
MSNPGSVITISKGMMGFFGSEVICVASSSDLALEWIQVNMPEFKLDELRHKENPNNFIFISEKDQRSYISFSLDKTVPFAG